MSNHNGRLVESTPLLPTQVRSQSSIQKWLNQNVNRDYADLLLLLGYIVTGLADSSSISKWDTFVSMQTGNTIYIGLGFANLSGSSRWRKAIVSVVGFCAGSFAYSRWHDGLGPKRRWVMVSSYLSQLLCIVASAAIVMLDHAIGSSDELRWQIMLPVVLMAFQAGGQAVTSRAVQLNSLTSVVLTSIYCDLFSDANLFAGLAENPERNQRAAAPFALLFGAVCGGFLARTSFGIATGLWTAAVLKLGIVIAWVLWKPAAKEDEDD